MRPSVALATHRAGLREIIANHGFENPRVFGSVNRAEDQEGSDLDILVDASARVSLFDLVAAQIAAETLTGVQIDLCTPDSLSAHFRNVVLREARPL